MAQKIVQLFPALLLWSVISYGQSAPNLTVQQLLANPKIWGKDLPTALANVSAMHKIGETQVAVFSDSVQTTSGTKLEQAEVHIAAFQRALRSISPSEKAEYHAALDCKKGVFKAMCSSPVVATSEQIEKVEENDGVRLAATSPKLQFLKPGANIDTVQAELGKPEQVTQQVIQTKYERRPIILTKYQYASGAVVFATSNLKPNGKLDRVFLDTEAISKALNEKAR